MNKKKIFLFVLISVGSCLPAVLGVEGSMSYPTFDSIMESEGVSVVNVAIPPPFPIDCLFIPGRFTPYSPAEISWVQNFVRSGGTLIICGEWYMMGVWSEYANSILSAGGWETGVRIRPTLVSDSLHYFEGGSTLVDPFCWFYTSDIFREPLMFGIDSLGFFASSVLNVFSPARICARTMWSATSDTFPIFKDPLIAIVEIGAGRLIVSSDSNILTVSGDTLLMRYWRNIGNRRLLENLAYILNGGTPSVTENSRLPQKDISIYPNPFNSACRVDGEGTAIVFDINGRIIDKLELPTNWIPENNLPNGIYFLKNIEGKVARAVLAR